MTTPPGEPVNWDTELRSVEMVMCPICEAKQGETCRHPDGSTASPPHFARIRVTLVG